MTAPSFLRFASRQASVRLLVFLAMGCFLGLASPVGDLKAQESPAAKKVLVVPITGMIDLGLAPFVGRTLERAEKEGFAALIFRIDTFGGRLDAAVQIRDAILESKVPTVAFVDGRAISAGALISLSCTKLFMQRGSTIGAATPVQMGGGQSPEAVEEKTISYFRGEMRATAERRGRPAKVAEAMVDRDIALEGVTEKGKLLTMTDVEALQHGLIDGQVEDLAGVLAAMDLTGASAVEVEINWAEEVVRFLTSPVVNSLLITLGMLGLVLEFKTPGMGLGAGISALCFALFFFGQYIVELAGWEEILAFVLGVVLVLLEILVLPGFGIAGVAGAGLLLGSVFFSLLSADLPLSFGVVAETAMHLTVTLVLAILVALLGFRLFPTSKLGRSVVLDQTLAPRSGTTPGGGTIKNPVSPQQRGTALTSLRPAGTARFEGGKVDVVTEGDFVEAGSVIEVVEVAGSRVVVRRVVD